MGRGDHPINNAGLSLFERTTRKVLLTPYGMAFLSSAQQLLNKLDLALKNLQEQANGLIGTIRVAAGTAISTTLLPVVISTFARRYPNITIHLFNDTSGGVMRRVGACILSALAASHPLSEDLVYKLIDSTRLRRELYLFSRKNAVPSAALSLFIDVIYEVLPSVYFREGVTIESGLKSEVFI